MDTVFRALHPTALKKIKMLNIFLRVYIFEWNFICELLNGSYVHK